MDLSKIKYSPKGTLQNPYWEYWTNSAVKKGNRRKGYWVRVYGKIKNCPVCNKKFFATASQLRICKNQNNISCSCKCAGFLRKGIKNYNWKGGKAIVKNYILVSVPNHPAKDKRGYVPEHRLVMEKHLGRYLERWEIVHHLNHNSQDNRIENLELYSNTHPLDVDTRLKQEIKRLQCLLIKNGIAF